MTSSKNEKKQKAELSDSNEWLNENLKNLEELYLRDCEAKDGYENAVYTPNKVEQVTN